MFFRSGKSGRRSRGRSRGSGLSRYLAANRPTAFNPRLATCLDNLSHRLSTLGRREDALVAIREVIELHCQQAKARPPLIRNRDLAASLKHLSLRLSDLGCEEKEVQEASWKEEDV